MAANDHCESRIIEIGGLAPGETGKTTAFAKLMLLQTAQKSRARPVGAFCAGKD